MAMTPLNYTPPTGYAGYGNDTRELKPGNKNPFTGKIIPGKTPEIPPPTDPVEIAKRKAQAGVMTKPISRPTTGIPDLDAPMPLAPAPGKKSISTPKMDEAIAKSLAKNTSPYDKLTNILRGRPNIAPSPTATPMVQQKPNLRKIINQLKQQEMMMGKRPYQQQMDEQARMQMRPQPTPSAVELQKIYQQMQQPLTSYYMQEPLQQPLTSYYMQEPLQQLPLQQQPPMQQLPQPNIPYYMQDTFGSPQPMQPQKPSAGLGSLMPQRFNTSYGGGMGQQPMGTQNTQLGNMGQPAQNTQSAFGGNILGQKNAFG